MGGNYIKIDRGILEWEWYKNTNTKTVFLHCLLKANWKDGRFEGKEVKRGSFITSVRNLSLETELSIQEVKTALNHLKSTGELTIKGYSKFSLITVNNYDLYQCINQQSTNNQPTTNQQATNEQQSSNHQATTIEEYKEYKEREEKKEKIINTFSKENVSPDISGQHTQKSRSADNMSDERRKSVKRIVEYLNSKCGTHYRHSTDKTKICINARMNDGFSEQDFFTVIDIKSAEWMGTSWQKFLRPETLFGTKFESYLNQQPESQQTSNSQQDTYWQY